MNEIIGLDNVQFLNTCIIFFKTHLKQIGDINSLSRSNAGQNGKSKLVVTLISLEIVYRTHIII